MIFGIVSIIHASRDRATHQISISYQNHVHRVNILFSAFYHTIQYADDNHATAPAHYYS